jgi:hypothetical protein
LESADKTACYHRAVTPRGRAARALLPHCLVALSLLPSSSASGSAPPFDELLAELSSAIASAVASNEAVQIVAANPGQDDHARALSALLARRGLRIGSDEDGRFTAITCACAITVRERVCLAEVRRDDSTRLLSARRTLEPSEVAAATTPMVLELRPLLSQRTPVLDVAVADPRMLVLDSSSVTRHERTAQGWQVRESKSIPVSRSRPRDLRGRIVSTATTFEAHLPGVVCRGTLEPLTMSCVEQQVPWPVGFDNQGITPARNYFSLPNGAYYGMASLEAEAGAPWLAARRDGALVLLDSARVPVSPPIASGDDVVRLNTECASGSHVLLSASGAEGTHDSVRLFRVADSRLQPSTPPATLPGTLTAMWPAFDANTATIVSRNPTAGGYEAFQVRVSCGR